MHASVVLVRGTVIVNRLGDAAGVAAEALIFVHSATSLKKPSIVTEKAQSDATRL